MMNFLTKYNSYNGLIEKNFRIIHVGKEVSDCGPGPVEVHEVVNDRGDEVVDEINQVSK